MVKMDDLAAVVCRPALPKDTAEVMELCSHIWEGGDYIPDVWQEWLSDPQGMLGVAEYGGRVVGIFKLTRFGPQEWYMEGLRVHPDFQGKGIAAHIHEFVLATWRRIGGGLIRLATGSYNVKVHKLCERTGFKRIAEFIPYRGSELIEPANNFRQLSLAEAPEALEFVLNSPTLPLSHGLIDLGWVWADPQLKHIEEAVQEGHAWWWCDGLGFLSVWLDQERDEHSPAIQLVACPVDKLVELLVDYRRLMGALHYPSPGWVAPNDPEVLSYLEATGFQRSWDVSIYIYELRP